MVQRYGLWPALLLAAACCQAAEAQVTWRELAPHPRLFADGARFNAVKAQKDPVSRQLFALLAQDAERKLAAARISYPATGFKFAAVREAQGRILTLAFAYRLHGDRRFLERAREELLALAALPDWAPHHFLDAGEASLAAAIGLDWLYDDLTPADRDKVAASIVRNALTPSLAAREGRGEWVDGDFNWNQVCHGGLIAGALAVAEREPELARRIVDRAVRNIPKAGAVYSPDGVYPEGPNYWSYGTTFHVIAVEALRSALGSSYGLEASAGFLKTAGFIEQAVGPTGEDFNFSDYHERPKSEPVLLWFARELGRRDVARQELRNLDAMSRVPIEPSRHLGLELLWWNPGLPEEQSTTELPLHWTAGGATPLAAMRSAWNDPRAAYVAVKGGSANRSHAHMDAGSFVLEADGVRWAVDLGAESYDKMRAAGLTLWNYAQDSTRWQAFRVGPEGHNILRFNRAWQRVDGAAAISALAGEPDAVGDMVDLTPVYRDEASKVQRRIRLRRDRSISIEDEWTAGERDVDVCWQWLTGATATAGPDGFALQQQGETLRLQATGSARLSLAVEDVSAPRSPIDSPNPGLKRLIIRMWTKARHSGRLSVVATPGKGR